MRRARPIWTFVTHDGGTRAESPSQRKSRRSTASRASGRRRRPFPASLTIAVSREAGSRGGTIARRVGRKLGWQVYNQELLEYIAQEGVFTEGVVANLSPAGLGLGRGAAAALLRSRTSSQHPTVVDLARIVLALGAQGEVVLLGRGAGCILPRDTTLHVRIMAPLQDRIAYMSQWLRLTSMEAAEQVRLRDGAAPTSFAPTSSASRATCISTTSC